MKKFKIYFILLGMLFFIGACTDLEENLTGDITNEITIEGISTGGGGGGGGVLGGAYAELRNAGTATNSGYYVIHEISSDEMFIGAKGGDWFDGGKFIRLHRHTWDATVAEINGTWTQTYNAIGTTNELLASGNLDANQEAQARALRAYFYLRLLDTYGNVKIITTPNKDEPQSNRQQVFEFVESELLSAIGASAITPGLDLSGSALGEEVNPYRINVYGALGILAKLYLNAEVYTGTARWDEAALAAGYIIDSGLYQLCGDDCKVTNLGKRPAVASDPDELTGYAAVFAPNNEGNPEHIFVVEYDEVTGTGMNFSQMNLHYSSQFTWNLQSQPWNGFATLEEFYNLYEAGDKRRVNNFLVGPQLDFGGSAILDYASDDDDLQLNYTPQINELEPNSRREAGVRGAKFSFKQLGRDNMNNDYPIIRLGQVYLIRGEALARAAGDWNASLNDVNVVRQRAGVSPYTTITADEFLDERGREMYMEVTRRTDLIRFGKFNDPWWEKPASDPFRNIFPIPNDQIIASNGTLTQNPGY